MNSGFATGVAWVVLAAALLFFALHYFSSNNLESGGGVSLPTPHTQQMQR